MKKSLLILILVVCLFLEVLSVAESTPVKLTVWSIYGENTPEYGIIKELASNYTKTSGNPVDIIITTWDDVRPKLALAAPVGEGPDVIVAMPHDWLGQLVKQGVLLGFDSSVFGDELSQYPPSHLRAITYEGKLYGFPVFAECVALVYNKKLVPKPPSTFNELITLAKSLNNPSKDQWGFLMPILEQYHTYSIIRGFGGYIFRWTGKEYHINDIGLNNSGAIRGFQFLQDLYLKDKLFPEAIVDRTNMHAITTGKFEEGKVGMQINGPWVTAGIVKAKIDYGVAMIPKLSNNVYPKPFTGVYFIGVNAYTRNQSQAIELAKTLSGREAQIKYTLLTGRIPVRFDVLKSSEIRNKSPLTVAWANQASIGEPMPNIPEMVQVWKPWGDAMDVIIPGKAPIKQTLDIAVQQIRQGIASMRK
jgi:maltose-binding protein MalE